MRFKAPPQLLERVLRFRAIQHKEGRVTLWGIPATINQSYSNVYLQKLIEKKYGAKECTNIFYSLGVFQGRAAFKMISDRFGYAKTFQDKKKLLKFELGQGIVTGHGIFNWIRMDFNKNVFISKGISPHAEEYKRFFGIQKNPVDHFLRGVGSAYIEEVIGKGTFCVESKCIARGDKYCEFMIKSLESWDRSDSKFKSQFVEKPLGMKELGSKIDSYIILK
jgi:predicted hydrocarbon binding protein